jgi:hypothetical protein
MMENKITVTNFNKKDLLWNLGMRIILTILNRVDARTKLMLC